MHSKKKEDHFEDFFSDISSTLEDLCQSGFHTVHDSTLQELKERGETAAEYGMQHLSNLNYPGAGTEFPLTGVKILSARNIIRNW